MLTPGRVGGIGFRPIAKARAIGLRQQPQGVARFTGCRQCRRPRKLRGDYPVMLWSGPDFSHSAQASRAKLFYHRREAWQGPASTLPYPSSIPWSCDSGTLQEPVIQGAVSSSFRSGPNVLQLQGRPGWWGGGVGAVSQGGGGGE